MFPAPTTIAISTPRSCTSLISRAIRSTSRRSRPYSCSPISASPESFRSTRPKTGRAPFPSTRKGVTDEVEHLGVLLVQRLPDRRAVVDPFLVEQHVLAEEALAEHSLDDLVAHLLGLRLDLLRALEDIPLRPELLGRNLVPRRVARRRERDVHCQLARQLRRAANLHEHADLVRRRVHVRADRLVALTLEAGRAAHGDVLADLADELDALVLELLRGVWAVALDGLEDPLGESEELLVLRHRLGLAPDSDQRASVLGDPREDDALGGLPAGALACLGHPALAQKPLRGLDVAAGLLQGALAIHHSGARLLAELLDEPGWNLGRAHWASPSSAGASSAASVSAALSAWPISSCSTGVSSAAGSGSAAASSGWPFRSNSSAVAPVLPSSIASPIARTMRLHERIASSFPGITRSTSSGSQFVSTRPMIGSPRRLASRTAICSLRRSMTNSASGWRLRSATPPRFASSFSSSLSIVSRSLAGRRSSWPSSLSRRNSWSRSIRLDMVRQFVIRPPSQRWLTYGMPTRFACSSTASCACFFVPTNRTVPFFPARSRAKSHAWSSSSAVFCRSM